MKKTLIICSTIFLCTFLICTTLFLGLENNRYVSYDNFNIPSILDHKTGKIYSINTVQNKILISDLPNNIVKVIEYTEN